MRRLMEILRDAPSGDIAELQKRYQSSCYTLQRLGRKARVPQTAWVGTAIDLARFQRDLLSRYSHHFPTLTDVEDFVRRLQTDLGLLTSRERDVFIKAYTFWVTWDEASPQDDPFGFVVHHLADEVRGALGLDERAAGPLLLFRYQMPPRTVVHRPTIADAGLFPYFAPPIRSETRHGMTRPWERLDLSVGGRTLPIEAGPRPEGVHRPISIRALRDLVEELP